MVRRPKREHKNVHLTKWEIKGLKNMVTSNFIWSFIYFSICWTTTVWRRFPRWTFLFRQRFFVICWRRFLYCLINQFICCLTGKQCVELPAENAEDEKPENCQDDSRPSSRCSHENGQTEMKNSPEVGNSSKNIPSNFSIKWITKLLRNL
jgi:hypothetical protein